MTVTEQFQHAIAQGEPLQWDKLCIELDAEHASAQNMRAREALLATFTIIADVVERSAQAGPALAQFKDVRRRAYHRLLLRESCLEGRLSAKTLYEVSEREYLKGRMAQDDPMRTAATAGFARFSKRAAAAAALDFEARRARSAAASAGPSGKVQRLWARLAAMAGLARRASAPWRSTAGASRF